MYHLVGIMSNYILLAILLMVAYLLYIQHKVAAYVYLLMWKKGQTHTIPQTLPDIIARIIYKSWGWDKLKAFYPKDLRGFHDIDPDHLDPEFKRKLGLFIKAVIARIIYKTLLYGWKAFQMLLLCMRWALVVYLPRITCPVIRVLFDLIGPKTLCLCLLRVLAPCMILMGLFYLPDGSVTYRKYMWFAWIWLVCCMYQYLVRVLRL